MIFPPPDVQGLPSISQPDRRPSSRKALDRAWRCCVAAAESAPATETTTATNSMRSTTARLVIDVLPSSQTRLVPMDGVAEITVLSFPGHMEPPELRKLRWLTRDGPVRRGAVEFCPSGSRSGAETPSPWLGGRGRFPGARIVEIEPVRVVHGRLPVCGGAGLTCHSRPCRRAKRRRPTRLRRPVHRKRHKGLVVAVGQVAST